jgi:AraC-like DNA-binding protein
MSSLPRCRVVAGYLGAWPERVRDEVVVRAAGHLPVLAWQVRLGDVRCCLFDGDDVDVSPHRWEPVSDGIVVGYVARGAVLVTQGRRTVEVRSGRIVLYDGLTPYRIRSAAAHRFLIAHVRATAVRFRRESRDALVATDLSGFPSATALAGMLGALARSARKPAAREPTPAAGAHLGDAVVACLHALAAEVRGVGGGRSTALFAELTDWLDGNLADPELSAERLGATKFLSARYVRKVFADHDTTVSAYVRTHRLERIRDELLAPWGVHLPVSAIAARWGYPDASVFTRAFARQFGEAPQRFRQARDGRRHRPGPRRAPDERGPMIDIDMHR